MLHLPAQPRVEDVGELPAAIRRRPGEEETLPSTAPSSRCSRVPACCQQMRASRDLRCARWRLPRPARGNAGGTGPHPMDRPPRPQGRPGTDSARQTASRKRGEHAPILLQRDPHRLAQLATLGPRTRVAVVLGRAAILHRHPIPLESSAGHLALGAALRADAAHRPSVVIDHVVKPADKLRGLPIVPAVADVDDRQRVPVVPQLADQLPIVVGAVAATSWQRSTICGCCSSSWSSTL